MDKVTLDEQIRHLEGIKSVLENILHEMDAYLIGEPKKILDRSRTDAFPGDVAEYYEKNFLEPDIMTVNDCKERFIYPSIKYIEEQIEGLKRIYYDVDGQYRYIN